jgi:ankyrin repeat protein
MLAEDSEIHGAVLNNDIDAVEEFLKKETNINVSDKGGRTALHLALSYNRPFTQKLLSFPGVDANKPDAVLKWTSLWYADRTKQWMAMDNLLQNGAYTDDTVLQDVRVNPRNGDRELCGNVCQSDSHSCWSSC